MQARFINIIQQDFDPCFVLLLTQRILLLMPMRLLFWVSLEYIFSMSHESVLFIYLFMYYFVSSFCSAIFWSQIMIHKCFSGHDQPVIKLFEKGSTSMGFLGEMSMWGSSKIPTSDIMTNIINIWYQLNDVVRYLWQRYAVEAGYLTFNQLHSKHQCTRHVTY